MTVPDTDIEALIEDGEIVESRHNREADYLAAFQTHKLSVGPFTLHMENRIYEEEQLRGKAKALWQDLCALEEAVGEQPGTLTVYLVERTVEGRPQAVGAQVFCSLTDWESGAGREALIGAAYGLRCPWQQAGLADLVFGRESNLSLRAYYADEAHALTASCSAIHLSPVLSDEETVLAARATARSLCAYLLEHEGFAAFRAAEDPGAVLPAWAESLGISPAPRLPEGSAQAATLTLGSRAGWICALEVQNFTVLLTEDSWLLDPDGLYAWFCSFFTGMDLVLEQIGQEAPSALALARERYAEPITISFLSMEQPTYAFPTRNQIDLTKANAVWHEMVHLLLREKRLRSGQNWQE
jgi:hypothetical protein